MVNNTHPMSLDEAVGVARHFRQQITALAKVAELVTAADEARAVVQERSCQLAAMDAQRVVLRDEMDRHQAAVVAAKREREQIIADANRTAAQARDAAEEDAARRIAAREAEHRTTMETAQAVLDGIKLESEEALERLRTATEMKAAVAAELVEKERKLSEIRAAIATLTQG